MTAEFTTAGPWEVKKDDDQFRIRQKGTVKRIAGGTLERPVGEGFNYRLDAILASCAPDLRDMLVSVVEELDKYQNTPHPEGCDGARDYLVKIMNAKHLIAKASGESK